jgi:hypothetical protein
LLKKTNSDSTKKFSETNIINMLELLIDNIFVIFGRRVFQQTVGTKWVQILLLFLPTCSFNFTFRYIDDVLSLNNSKFGDFVDRIYPIELEIKDTTDTDTSASHLDLRLENDSEGRLRTKLYDKGDVFNFPIVYFPFIYSSNPAAPAYEVYISQLIRYFRACDSY